MTTTPGDVQSARIVKSAAATAAALAPQPLTLPELLPGHSPQQAAHARQAAAAEHARQEAERAAQQQRAVHAAHAQGRAEGQAAAEQEGVAAIRALLDATQQVTATAAEQARAQVAADTRALLATAVEIAQWMAGRVLAADPDLLLPRLEQALKDVFEPDTAVITCNPDDLTQLQAWQARRASDGQPATFALQPEPSVPRGQARLRAGSGQHADLTVAAAAARALRALDVEQETP